MKIQIQKENKKVQIQLGLQSFYPETKKKLEELSKKHGVSIAVLVKTIIENIIDELE